MKVKGGEGELIDLSFVGVLKSLYLFIGRTLIIYH